MRKKISKQIIMFKNIEKYLIPMLEELEFTGEIKRQRCSICKLRLKKNDDVLSCPQCESLFHKEHLVRWLKEIPECPVCVHDFSDIVKKYRDVLFKEDQASIIPEQHESETYTLFNKDPLKGRIALRIFLTIFGLIFVFGSQSFSLVLPWNFALQLNIVLYLFGMIGMATIYFGNKKMMMDITNQWAKMIFTSDNILITSETVHNLEIWEEDVTKIELYHKTSPPDEGSRREYHVAFRIFTIKNKIYDFGYISTAYDEFVTLGIYRTLKQKIRKYYGIIVDDPRRHLGTYMSEGLARNWKFILIATLIHLVLSAVCIVIGYYLI